MSPTSYSAIFSGTGENAGRLREIDWATHSLGSPDGWSTELKFCVELMLNSKQPMFLMWGKDLTMIYNDAYNEIVAEKHPNSFLAPARKVWAEIWDEIEPLIESVINDGEPFYFENQPFLLNRHGYDEESYFTFSYTPVSGNGHGYEGLFCIPTDQTARIVGDRRLQALHELTAFTNQVMSVSDVCSEIVAPLEKITKDFPFSLIYLADPDDREMLVLRQSVGIDPDHEAAPEKLSLSNQEGLIWPVQRVASSGIEVMEELPDNLPSGPWAASPTRVALVPIRGAGEGVTEGVLVVGLNPYCAFDDQFSGFLSLVAGQISAAFVKARVVEKERRQAQELLIESRRKDEFLATLAHELRNPIAPIRTGLEVLRNTPADSDQAAAVHEMMGRQMEQMVRLIDDLLDVSRITRGKVALQLERIDLRDAVGIATEASRPVLEAAGHQFEILVPEGATEDFEVKGDLNRLAQVFSNLLNNAAKYTPEGGSVTFRIESEEQWLMVVVEDNGHGIPKSNQARIFEMFEQLDSDLSNNDGLGIGLSLARSLIEMHEGEIRVESAGEGRGSIFSVKLPRFSEEEITEGDFRTTIGGSSESPIPPSGKAGKRVLVADDNENSTFALKLFFEMEGYEVKVAANGAEAVSMAKEFSPWLILMDIGMPIMDGHEAARCIREIPGGKDVFMVALTGWGAREDIAKTQEAGFDKHLVKPANPEILRELLVTI